VQQLAAGQQQLGGGVQQLTQEAGGVVQQLAAGQQQLVQQTGSAKGAHRRGAPALEEWLVASQWRSG
jgi:hypothetical protein